MIDEILTDQVTIIDECPFLQAKQYNFNYVLSSTRDSGNSMTCSNQVRSAFVVFLHRKNNIITLIFTQLWVLLGH